eukprot:3580017-Prymnesium_polylepis.1
MTAQCNDAHHQLAGGRRAGDSQQSSLLAGGLRDAHGRAHATHTRARDTHTRTARHQRKPGQRGPAIAEWRRAHSPNHRTPHGHIESVAEGGGGGVVEGHGRGGGIREGHGGHRVEGLRADAVDEGPREEPGEAEERHVEEPRPVAAGARGEAAHADGRRVEP